MRVNKDYVIATLLIGASITYLVISPDFSREDRNELIDLVQQQGYCAAVRDYRTEIPAECHSAQTEARTSRLTELRNRLRVQPVFSGMPDKAPDMLPKPVGV